MPVRPYWRNRGFTVSYLSRNTSSKVRKRSLDHPTFSEDSQVGKASCVEPAAIECSQLTFEQLLQDGQIARPLRRDEVVAEKHCVPRRFAIADHAPRSLCRTGSASRTTESAHRSLRYSSSRRPPPPLRQAHLRVPEPHAPSARADRDRPRGETKHLSGDRFSRRDHKPSCPGSTTYGTPPTSVVTIARP